MQTNSKSDPLLSQRVPANTAASSASLEAWQAHNTGPEEDESDYDDQEALDFDPRHINEENDELFIHGYGLLESYKGLLVSVKCAYMLQRMDERDKSDPDAARLYFLDERILFLSRAYKQPGIPAYRFMEEQIELLLRELRALRP